MAEEIAEKPRIVWGLQEQPKPASVLDEEREKHRRRAAKFGADFVEPTQRRELVLEAKKERWNREGFTTGFDVFSHEEVEKRRTRAERFHIEHPALEYRPDEEEEAKKRRAEKFGTSYQGTEAALMDMDLFEERREVPRDAERRPDAIHLYGVDVMSTAEVLRYFSDYGPTFVEWLDDSSCNVLFKDPHSVKRAIAGKGKPFPPQDSASTADLDPTDPANMPYFWHRGEDFVKDGTPVKLIYRMATALDAKDPTAPKPQSRELWKTAGTAGTKRSRHPQGRQQHGSGAEEGERPEKMEVDGGRQRGERGGRKQRRRKERHLVEGDGGGYEDDVDMHEADNEEGGEGAPVQTWREAGGVHGGGDLRRALKARRQSGPRRGARGYGEGEEFEPLDMGPPPELLRGEAVEVVLVVPPPADEE